MTDGAIVWTVLCILFGVGIAEFYHARQNTRDGQWSQMLQQQQRQVDELVEYIADHSEATAEGLGYDD